jgi:hypothetical protein
MTMCLCLEEQRKNAAMERATEEEQTVSLSTQFCLQLILQNIFVSLEVNRKKRTVIAVINSFPVVVHLEEDGIRNGMLTFKTERVINSLFGGCLSRGWNIFVMTSP